MRNPLTIEAFAEWAEKKPANETYDYCSSEACAAAQYLQSLGVQKYNLPSYKLPKGWLGPLQTGPDTFGALAQRLRASLNTGKG